MHGETGRGRRVALRGDPVRQIAAVAVDEVEAFAGGDQTAHGSKVGAWIVRPSRGYDPSHEALPPFERRCSARCIFAHGSALHLSVIEELRLSEQSQQTEPPRYWAQSTARWRQQQQDTPLRRFLGGSPVAVVVRLIVVSILVGALLMWLDIRPADVFAQLGDLLDRLSALGVQSLRDLGTYVVAGAVIVVPLWLVLRLMSYRGR